MCNQDEALSSGTSTNNNNNNHDDDKFCQTSFTLSVAQWFSMYKTLSLICSTPEKNAFNIYVLIVKLVTIMFDAFTQTSLHYPNLHKRSKAATKKRKILFPLLY